MSTEGLSYRDVDIGSLLAVVLVGGKGTRLMPYTATFPKPLVPLGDRPILEILLQRLLRAGIGHVVLAVGHLGELVEAYFSSRPNLLAQLDLSYLHEDEPLGTAGALSLLSGVTDTFLVMNGDVLTDLNFTDLLAFHRAAAGRSSRSPRTAASVAIDLGVLELADGDQVVGYLEKPSYGYNVSMGIYVFEPTVLRVHGTRRVPRLSRPRAAPARRRAPRGRVRDRLALARHRPTRRLRRSPGAGRDRPRGLPLMSGWRVPLSDLSYDEVEEQAVRGLLSTRWLSMGPEVQSFEAEFAALVDVRHTVAVSSGTAALHLAYWPHWVSGRETRSSNRR